MSETSVKSLRCRDDTMPKTVDTCTIKKAVRGRFESMQQSSTTPLGFSGLWKIIACSQIYLNSCIYRFWHGVIPTRVQYTEMYMYVHNAHCMCYHLCRFSDGYTLQAKVNAPPPVEPPPPTSPTKRGLSKSPTARSPPTSPAVTGSPPPLPSDVSPPQDMGAALVDELKVFIQQTFPGSALVEEHQASYIGLPEC